MDVVIINRNYPPAPGITGHSAAELAVYLAGRGITVTVVALSAPLSAGQAPSTSPDQTRSIRLVTVPGFYHGKQKLLRLLGSLVEGRRLARAACRESPDLLIAMSDPPLLPWWISRGAAAAGIPWIYWSMDLYPDAFAAAGLVSTRHPFFRLFQRRLRVSPPLRLLTLGPAQASALKRELGTTISTTILPCGIHDIPPSGNPPSWHRGPGKIVFAYLGNLGEAHDPDFVITLMKSLDPQRHLFLLAVSGIHAPRLLAAAREIEAACVVPHVSRSEMGWIDVHLATLKPSWDHVCVPSKAVSAVCSGGALLLNSSDQGDNWGLLQNASWRIDPTSDYASSVPAFLQSLGNEEIAEKKAAALVIATQLRELQSHSFEEIYACLMEAERLKS